MTDTANVHAADEHATAPAADTHGIAAPHDPTQDVNAKTTVLWLAFSTVSVFLSVWLLYQLYAWVVFNERYAKIEQAPTPGLVELRQTEQRMLDAGQEPNRISIEQAMQEMASK